MSDQVVYVSNARIERVKGPLRRAYLPQVKEPVLFGVHSEVAEHYGLNKTAKALHLDYNALKKRLKTMPDGNESSPAFIELISPPASSSNSECLIELEAPHGEKMRIHLKGTALPDLAAMGNMFWRNKQ